MRRGGRYSVRRADAGGEQGFWPSYADMMSAVSLILFFLMLLSYIQNLITGNDLQNTQEVLADTEPDAAQGHHITGLFVCQSFALLFLFQQEFFAFDAAGIAGQAAVAAQDPVAGDEQGDGISAHSRAHGSGGCCQGVLPEPRSSAFHHRGW